VAYSIPRVQGLRRLHYWSAAWAARPRHVSTVLAPALPALILLAVTTAGMVDPPQSGLLSQLHLTKAASAESSSRPGSATWSVTAR
jgi:hypothetical protein